MSCLATYVLVSVALRHNSYAYGHCVPCLDVETLQRQARPAVCRGGLHPPDISTGRCNRPLHAIRPLYCRRLLLCLLFQRPVGITYMPLCHCALRSLHQSSYHYHGDKQNKNTTQINLQWCFCYCLTAPCDMGSIFPYASVSPWHMAGYCYRFWSAPT